ncbi:hypothetical protein HUJ04_005817 [Dendroctonus ponderosae]|nr:hypothetical protein HUJ04_005817 [Dendroctonus ponderosae]
MYDAPKKERLNEETKEMGGHAGTGFLALHYRNGISLHKGLHFRPVKAAFPHAISAVQSECAPVIVQISVVSEQGTAHVPASAVSHPPTSLGTSQYRNDACLVHLRTLDVSPGFAARKFLKYIVIAAEPKNGLVFSIGSPLLTMSFPAAGLIAGLDFALLFVYRRRFILSMIYQGLIWVVYQLAKVLVSISPNKLV